MVKLVMDLAYALTILDEVVNIQSFVILKGLILGQSFQRSLHRSALNIYLAAVFVFCISLGDKRFLMINFILIYPLINGKNNSLSACI